MCRLFAVLARAPVRVESAFEALAEQSREHKDGWGVAQFDAGPSPAVERGLEPAWSSARFRALGRSLESRALLAHLRLASVGSVALANTHPFVGRGWAFMHNGTVANFAAHQAELEALLPEDLRASLAGQTESERCLALFLSRLRPGGLEDPALALAWTLRTVAARCDPDAATPASLNFVACDGRRLVATRRGHTLWLYQADQVRAVASERLWPGEGWEELADGELLSIGEDLSVTRQPVAQAGQAAQPAA